MEYIEDKTKTKDGMRVLPISEEVQAAFKRVLSNRRKPRVEYMIDGVSGFLFLDERGKPTVAYQWEKKFQYSVQKYNSISFCEFYKETTEVSNVDDLLDIQRDGITVREMLETITENDVWIL